MEKREYYRAYDERYKTAHENGVSWFSSESTPIVLDLIQKYHFNCTTKMLEIGCGEGRDSISVLNKGYSLLATDISAEAICYCKAKFSQFSENFKVLDCLNEKIDSKFDFIFAIAVVHMLVVDEDRDLFYQFIRKHLADDGIALICSMGDGEFEMKSDINSAFKLQERDHQSGKMLVAGTSCRMVSFGRFENEINRNGLETLEKGITEAMPDFNSLMYAVVKKK